MNILSYLIYLSHCIFHEIHIVIGTLQQLHKRTYIYINWTNFFWNELCKIMLAAARPYYFILGYE